ncbi:MAG: hypothetical protein H0T59_01765 [Chloroflexi bacterium]|nr:hypothetical protein [Chloroflexota bacterium]
MTGGKGPGQGSPGTSRRGPATILPGAVSHCWDHLVITLRDAAGNETAFVSIYGIAYSASLGAGHVAIVEVAEAGGGTGRPGGPPDVPGGPLRAVLTDDLGLGARQIARLRGMGDGRAALLTAPRLATFRRVPFDATGFGFDIDTDGYQIEARWLDPGQPMWVDGRDGGFSDAEDIWAMFVGAPRARVMVNGVAAPGEPFQDDQWRPMLRRAFSSAHAAFAEVRVEPDRTPGD